METFDILGVEIFASGHWNGDTYTQDDLDAIITAFNENKSRITPYLKIGHGDKQALLAEDELPAAGWVDSLRRVGDKLVADFKRVPKKIYELMQAGAYRRPSVELYVNAKENGRTWPYMLKAVSILGAAMPAVSSLSDIIALYGLDVAAKVAYASEAEVRQVEVEINKGVRKMTNEIEKLSAELAEAHKKLAEFSLKGEETAKAIEASVKEIESLKAKVSEFEAQAKAEKARADEASSKVAQYAAEKKSLEIKAEVDELIRSTKLAPAQKDFAIALLEGMPEGELKFKHGEKEYKSRKEVLFAMIEAGSGVKLNTDTNTGAGTANRDGDNGESGVELDRKVKEYMEKNKSVSYRDALLIVSKGEK